MTEATLERGIREMIERLNRNKSLSRQALERAPENDRGQKLYFSGRIDTCSVLIESLQNLLESEETA